MASIQLQISVQPASQPQSAIGGVRQNAVHMHHRTDQLASQYRTEQLSWPNSLLSQPSVNHGLGHNHNDSDPGSCWPVLSCLMTGEFCDSYALTIYQLSPRLRAGAHQQLVHSALQRKLALAQGQQEAAQSGSR